jgi:hypothetical protein
LQREYEEFKVRINALVSKAHKVPEDGWTMQDGTPWPGNNVRDHPGMIQVCEYLSSFNALLIVIPFLNRQFFSMLHRFSLAKVEGMTLMEMNYHVWYMFPEKRDLDLITTKRLEL